MPLSPDDVAALSRLLDESATLSRDELGPWLAALDKAQPELSRRLRDMLRRQEQNHSTVLIPQLPRLDMDDDEDVATPGERVGPYRLLRRIGHGGMGSVWLAERIDGAFKRNVALKLPRLVWARGLTRRMTREREIGALLEHPNIARLYDAGVDHEGRPFIAMEYIDGKPLDVYCRELNLNVHQRLGLFLQIVRAIAYAHGRLVIHRDIKPANVLVDSSGQAHLLDFGIATLLDDASAVDAALTQEQGRLLTLNYASPEQIAGRPLGVTADIYSLGVLLFELLTGALPYTVKRNTRGAIEEAILSGDAPLASARVADASLARGLRGDIDAILTKALKGEPADRYQTAEALAEDIRRYLAGLPISARPDGALYRLRKAILRHRLPLMASAAVLVTAIVGASISLTQAHKANQEAERAQVATRFVSDLFALDTPQPTAEQGSALTHATRLERASQLIEERFREQPLIQAELFGLVSRVYLDLGMERRAIEFASRQLQILRDVDAAPTDIAQALLFMATAAAATGRSADAEDYAQQAVATLPKGSQVLHEALAELALRQVENGRREDVVRGTILEARQAHSSVRPRDTEPAALLWAEAELLELANRFDDALPKYREAIAKAIEQKGANSPEAIEKQLDLAYMLIVRNRSNEADAFGDSAIATLESSGGVRAIRAARAKAYLQATRLMMGAASYNETITNLDLISSRLKQIAIIVPNEVSAEIDFHKASAHATFGNYAQAHLLIQSSAPVLRASMQSFSTLFPVAAVAGEVAMHLGEHDAADRYLRERMDLRIKHGSGSKPFAAFDWAFVAINLSMQGRHSDADSFLSKAPTFVDEAADTEASYATVIPKARALIRMNSGDPWGAREVIGSKLAPVTEVDFSKVALDLVGEIACATGDKELGLSYLLAAIERPWKPVSPAHPRFARIRSIAGLCALSLGRTRLAKELAAAARHAFTVQPAVSPYFKEPLARLERLLQSK